MALKSKKYRRLLPLLPHELFVVIGIAIIAMLVSDLVTFVSHYYQSAIGAREFKDLLNNIVSGLVGVALLTFIITVFVHFLRHKAQKVRVLQTKVVIAFTKAVDESLSKSKLIDPHFREQLNP